MSLYVLLVFLTWSVLYWFFSKQKWFRIVCAVFLLVSVYGILLMTVLQRSPSDTHILVFASAYNREFYRELFMNTLLYFPFGLSLSVLAGPWTILAGFIVSFCIEAWQYLAGTGTAQVTDVITNTLGCFLGTLPFILTGYIKRRKQKTLPPS